jgi:hypothetical protein
MPTLYRATVVRVDSTGAYVEVPALGEGGEWGPLELLDIPLSVGDPVLVGTINDVMEDLALLGKLVEEVPDPPVVYSPPTNGQYVLYYENAAARNAAIPSPTSGVTTWLDDEQRLEIYTDEGTPGWTQVYAFKSGVLSLPTASKIGVGVSAPGSTVDSAVAAATTGFLAASQTGDGQKRLTVDHNGLFQWSSGSAGADVTMQRYATNPGLRVTPRLGVGGDPVAAATYTSIQSVDRVGYFSWNTQNALHALAHFYAEENTNTGSRLLASYVTADTQPRFSVNIAGKVEWGAGAASVVDTNLYRNAADELKTDDNLTVGGNQTVTGNLSVVGTMPDGVARYVTGAILTTTTAAIGNTETIVLSTPSTTWKAGRLYKITYAGMITGSVATNRPLWRVRKTDTAGTQLWANAKPIISVGSQHDGNFFGYFRCGVSDVTAVVALTLQASASFTATALETGVFEIHDVGTVASRPAGYATDIVAI